MKVELSQYEKPIKALLRKTRTSLEVYNRIIEITEEFLPCSACGELLPKESFSKASAFHNRNGRYTKCKECCKQERFDAEDEADLKLF